MEGRKVTKLRIIDTPKGIPSSHKKMLFFFLSHVLTARIFDEHPIIK